MEIRFPSLCSPLTFRIESECAFASRHQVFTQTANFPKVPNMLIRRQVRFDLSLISIPHRQFPALLSVSFLTEYALLSVFPFMTFNSSLLLYPYSFIFHCQTPRNNGKRENLIAGTVQRYSCVMWNKFTALFHSVSSIELNNISSYSSRPHCALFACGASSPCFTLPTDRNELLRSTMALNDCFMSPSFQSYQAPV